MKNLELKTKVFISAINMTITILQQDRPTLSSLTTVYNKIIYL